jgi:hypothetical protein
MGSFVCGADALVRLSTAAELRVSKITRLRAPWNPTFRKPRKVGHPAAGDTEPTSGLFRIPAAGCPIIAGNEAGLAESFEGGYRLPFRPDR